MPKRMSHPEVYWPGAISRVFVLFSFVSSAGTHPPVLLVDERVREADDYYLGRANLENVRRGLQSLRQAVAQNPRDFEAWWRIAKFTCYVAQHTSEPEKSKLLEEGIEAGKKAIGLESRRPEAHFWLGADYGLSVEDKSVLKGLLLVDTIRKEIQTSAQLDPDYEQGAAVRTLARIYYRAPFFKGGDKRRAIELLEGCLKRFPENSLTMLYLADSYVAVRRREQARELLEKILKLCPDPQYGPELAENQDEARARLAKSFAAGE